MFAKNWEGTTTLAAYGNDGFKEFFFFKLNFKGRLIAAAYTTAIVAEIGVDVDSALATSFGRSSTEHGLTGLCLVSSCSFKFDL